MTTKFNALTDLKKGSYNWKVKVRVIRFWRGSTKKGEPFKGFNLLLLDDKSNRIHAFVPGAIAEIVQQKILLGKIHTFSNFQVKEYKVEEKYKCIHYDKQVILSHQTTIVQLLEKDASIQNNVFDFYDLADMKTLANQNTYLTDVIGVVKFEDPTLRSFDNKFGVPQKNFKFEITDGRSTVKVTFWDAVADLFQNSLTEDLEQPLIIIIASAKVGWWQDEVDISNMPATMFSLNYKHHSVFEMRQMMSQPMFSQINFSSPQTDIIKLFPICDIKKLARNIWRSFLAAFFYITYTLNRVSTEKWYMYVCTSCNKQIEDVDGIYNCSKCNRNVPYPDKKFQVFTLCSDATGGIEIMLCDRQVRKIIGINVFEVDTQEKGEEQLPSDTEKMENKDYTIKILVKEINIDKLVQHYVATDLYEGFNTGEEDIINQNTPGPSSKHEMSEGSSSRYHLDGLSQLNFQSA